MADAVGVPRWFSARVDALDGHIRCLSGTMALRTIAEAGDFEELRADWARLRADIDSPFTQLDFVRSHIETLPAGRWGLVLGLFEQQRLTAAAPLILLRRPRRLVWLDTEGLSSALYLDRDRLRRLVDALFALRLPLAIQTLVPAGPTESALRRVRPRGWLTLARSWASGPSLPLEPGFEPLSALSRNRRSQLRRKLRRARSRAEVTFTVEGPEASLPASFADFVRLEASGWKGRTRTALAYDEAQREGLRRYLEASAAREETRIARMRVGETTVAMHLNVAVGGRLWSLKTAIDEDHKEIMPGFQLYAHTIRAAAQEGLERYEFLGASEPVKEIWGAGPVELHRRRFHPPTPTGGAALVDVLARKGARELAERAQEGRRRLRAR